MFYIVNQISAHILILLPSNKILTHFLKEQTTPHQYFLMDALKFYKTDEGPLLAPASFFEPRDYDYNGCGPEGIGEIVPDTIWGLDVSKVCCVHDHMSERCANLTDEIIADAVFAANLTLRIVNNSDGIKLWVRMLRATKYIIAVSCTTFTESYWKNNNVAFPHGRYLK